MECAGGGWEDEGRWINFCLGFTQLFDNIPPLLELLIKLLIQTNYNLNWQNLEPIKQLISTSKQGVMTGRVGGGDPFRPQPLGILSVVLVASSHNFLHKTSPFGPKGSMQTQLILASLWE